MIDAVSNVSVNVGAAQKSASRTAAPAVMTKEATPAPQPPSVGSFHIRMDNQLDMAIIEYRAADTGDVVRQYPTEAQIQAFSRAAETETLVAQEQPSEPETAVSVPDVPAQGTAPAQAGEGGDPVVATSADAAPAPAVNVTADGSSVPAYTSSTQVVTA